MISSKKIAYSISFLLSILCVWLYWFFQYRSIAYPSAFYFSNIGQIKEYMCEANTIKFSLKKPEYFFPSLLGAKSAPSNGETVNLKPESGCPTLFKPFMGSILYKNKITKGKLENITVDRAAFVCVNDAVPFLNMIEKIKGGGNKDTILKEFNDERNARKFKIYTFGTSNFKFKKIVGDEEEMEYFNGMNNQFNFLQKFL